VAERDFFKVLANYEAGRRGNPGYWKYTSYYNFHDAQFTTRQKGCTI